MGCEIKPATYIYNISIKNYICSPTLADPFSPRLSVWIAFGAELWPHKVCLWLCAGSSLALRPHTGMPLGLVCILIQWRVIHVMQLRMIWIDDSAIMWLNHVRICVKLKMLHYAYNFRLRGAPLRTALTVPRAPSGLSASGYGSLTDTYCNCCIGPCRRYRDTYMPKELRSWGAWFCIM